MKELEQIEPKTEESKAEEQASEYIPTTKKEFLEYRIRSLTVQIIAIDKKIEQKTAEGELIKQMSDGGELSASVTYESLSDLISARSKLTKELDATRYQLEELIAEEQQPNRNKIRVLGIRVGRSRR